MLTTSLREEFIQIGRGGRLVFFVFFCLFFFLSSTINCRCLKHVLVIGYYK